MPAREGVAGFLRENRLLDGDRLVEVAELCVNDAGNGPDGRPGTRLSAGPYRRYAERLVKRSDCDETVDPGTVYDRQFIVGRGHCADAQVVIRHILVVGRLRGGREPVNQIFERRIVEQRHGLVEAALGVGVALQPHRFVKFPEDAPELLSVLSVARCGSYLHRRGRAGSSCRATMKQWTRAPAPRTLGPSGRAVFDAVAAVGTDFAEGIASFHSRRAAVRHSGDAPLSAAIIASGFRHREAGSRPPNRFNGSRGRPPKTGPAPLRNRNESPIQPNIQSVTDRSRLA